MVRKLSCYYFILLAITCYLFPTTVHSLDGDCQEAVRLYNHAIEIEDFTEKERLFTLALSYNCKDKRIVAKIHNNVADIYEQHGWIEKAIGEYHKAIEDDPFLLTPYLSLGDIYTKLKITKDADRFYEKAFLLKNYKSSQQIVEYLNPIRAIGVSPRVRLYFGFDLADLSNEAAEQLDALSSALKDRDLLQYRFSIEGHTSSEGTRKYNQALSERRAKAVKEWLVAHDICENRLIAVGFGENKPVADNSREEGRRHNRRVELRTIGVADVGGFRSNSGAELLEAFQVLRDGERFIAEQRYKEAMQKIIEAMKVFERERNVEGIKAAIKDLTLVYLFLEDWEKAEHYRKQLQ